MLLGIGICIPLGFSNQYVIYAHYAPRSYPAPEAVALVGNTAWLAALTMLVSSFLFFPDGRLLSRRWRWFARLALVAVIVGELAQTLDPQGLDNGPTRLHNPIGIPGASNLLQGVYALASLSLLVVLVAGLVSQVLRYRRGDRETRHQLKWVMAALTILVTTSVITIMAGPVLNLPAWVGTTVDGLGYLVIPLAIGVAILKYRLYDIDVVISRTLVYGALAAFITAVYVGSVVGVGTLVGSGGRPDLVLSIVATAIVAVAFQPVRERLQKVANRLVYGRRATPYEVLSQFSERVAETYAADEALPRMARVLAEGTGADSAAVWLRTGAEIRPAAFHPAMSNGLRAQPVTGQVLPALPEADRAVPVRHQGELLGALTVQKRKGETLTPIEEKLLEDLAHQAGLVLKNVGLTADLQARLEDLRESRKRLVAAQDQERRKLERDLHDGAQQHLVAIKVKLGLAEVLAAKDPEKARAILAELKQDADEALETLRDLARGIYPPLLADKGLSAALEAQARKAMLPVTVEADGIGRYPQEVEAAVYFCVLEALQNVQKYAEANHAVVRLREENDVLSFEVEDDGHGFDPVTAKRGSGLTNMTDRLDAVGGTVQVQSAPGKGARLEGRLPIAAAAPT